MLSKVSTFSIFLLLAWLMFPFSQVQAQACICDAGFVETSTWEDSVLYCNTPDASFGGVYNMDSIGASGFNNYAYVITNSQGIILATAVGDLVDVTAAPPGECWVFGVAYTGNLTATPGQNIYMTTLSDVCYDLSGNFVTIFREATDGGYVQSASGADTLNICYNDPTQPTTFAFDSTNASGPNFAYVVTDANGVILGLPPGDMVDFSGAGPGECWVWGLSYTGNLSCAIGDNATTAALSDGCFDLSANFVVVLREDVDGGYVSAASGADTLNICYNDPSLPTAFAFDSTNTMGPNFAYVVTDANGVILGLPPGDMVDFAGAGPGECWVWGLSYTGNITAMMGDNATTTALTDGCFDLSANFVVVLREDVDGGYVQSASGADTLNICYNDPSLPTAFAFDSTNTMGPNFAYVVTDANGVILGLPPGDMVDFSGAGPGECWVWGLSYTGNITAMMGDNATTTALTDGCFDLSDNFVVVLREDVDGGYVQSAAGADTLNICYNDPTLPTTFAFDSTNTMGPNFAYVVTDANGVILGLPPGDMVDFSGAGPGECWVWGLSYTGNITAMMGDNATTTALTDGCFDLSDNFVVVLREDVDGGYVQSAAGADTLNICYNDPTLPTTFAFDSTNTMGPNFAYVVTDANGVILGLPPGDMVDFSGAGPGECWVWGLSYTGTLSCVVGDNATTTALSDGCFDLSSNFVVVLREDVDGGYVQSASGADTLNICYNDPSLPTTFAFDSTNTMGPNFAYVVTDANGVILGLPPGDMVDFSGAGPGECWVWGLSYTGNITAMMGDNATTTALTDGCFDLSDNFVVVLREDVDGGYVQSAAGADTLNICYNDPTLPTTFAFDSTNTMGPNFAYVVTDANGVILGLPPGDMVDFSGAGPGECWVWGLSYTGNITAMMGDNATTTALTDGCFDLSSNFVVVLREDVDAGVVKSELNGPNNIYICYNDPNSPTVYAMDSLGATGPNFTYLVTDTNGVILGIPPGDMVDFTNAGPGVCRVWGLAYSGMLTANVGDDATAIALSSGCFDLSNNYIDVIREDVDAGVVKSELNGPNNIYICYNDPNSPTVYAMDSLGATGPNFTYLVTDTNGVILGIPPGDMVDFTNAGPGVCRVWGLAYSGMLTANVGDDATAIALSSGCFDLSNNYIDVIREDVDAGVVKSELNGPNNIYICYNDPNSPTVYAMDSLGATGPNFTYLVTDTNGVILGIPPGDMVDFTNAGPGVCRVWGLAYSGMLTANVGDDATAIALSSACFDLSNNYIDVLREDVDGGFVSAESGADTLYVCYTDTIADVFAFDSLGTIGTQFTYVVTDPNGVILGVPPADMVDFTNAGPGECWVWGLSYTGSVTAMVGDNASTTALSDGCFDLSDNFIVVLRDSSGSACGQQIVVPGGNGAEMTVFPNPVNTMVNLVVPASLLTEGKSTIEVFNSKGEVIETRSVAADTQFPLQVTIDAIGYPQGIYIVRLINGSYVAQSKFAKL